MREKPTVHPVLACTWAMMIFSSRLINALFDFYYFSYVVYGCFLLSIAWIISRSLAGTFKLSLRPLWPLLLMVVPFVWGGIRGYTHRLDIPDRIGFESAADYRLSHIYIREAIIVPLLQPLLAALIAVSITNGMDARRVTRAVLTFSFVSALAIISFAIVTGASLTQLADRDEIPLAALGLHPNALGSLMVLAYALTVGVLSSTSSQRTRLVLLSALAVITVALLLTFSRGAYSGFIVVNVLLFVRGRPVTKVLFVVAVLVVLFALPSEVYERIGWGSDSGDINQISAGRITGIWLPLLDDVYNNVLFGQGLLSIMWTAAQVNETIYAVALAHNAYLDLLLDLGIVGAVPILCFYVLMWRRFRTGYRIDGNAHRGFFLGGSLAIIALAVMSTTMERLTPFSTHYLLWIAIGVLLGRSALIGSQRRAT